MHSRHIVRSLLAIAAIVHPLGLAAQGAAVPSRPAVTSSRPGAVSRAAAAFHPDRLARIDSWIESLVAQRQIPGAVVMLVKDGQVAYHKAWGVRELGKPEALRTDDIFRIASQTKAITSLAVMMLWEEGRFQLDDPVSRYLPSFAKRTVLTKFNPADSSYESRPAKGRMTIRQLLTHTSGLDYADIGSDEFKAIYAKAGLTALGREGDVLAERIEALAKLPLHSDPGTEWRYSLSIDVLGRLVELWSGMPFDTFLRTRIFDPLGMKDTWFALPADRQARLVALHQMKDDTLVGWHARDGGLTHPDFPLRRVTYFSGGGGLVSTTSDYARFLQLFLNGGELDGVRLVGRKTVELMLTNHVAALEPKFGLGFGLETTDGDAQSPLSAGSFEWGGAFNTTYWADPKERLVALVYTNTFGAPVALGDTFKTLVYAALK
ncbi:MAG TPA: serine hydrolase domain-containing protein [Gemmatimonadaceae bacterium]|jgi:CubicO group peptidase (beta-lactamase class C family)|nr:serine hydrolase domain-containing protein [Gemmatimonadaceae bacterium]HPV75485.1 serine hydrolase domain-containing protein [Gemmatimonadaceae bacterium]